MAKILANILPSAQDKLTKVRKNWQWAKTELDNLPSLYEGKKQKALNFIQRHNDRLLAKPAFDACDKQEFIDEILASRLQAYDKHRYMSHRALNHSLYKGIFKAIKKGESYDQLFEKHNAGYDALNLKREKYITKLGKIKDLFLKVFSKSDDTKYVVLKEKLVAKYAEQEKSITERLEARRDKRASKLQAKMSSYEAKMASIKENIQSACELPEDVLLRVNGLKMYFGGLKAVDDLTFDVKKGEIFGLIGPNGAGKTTVFNCITRFYNATDGDMYFENKQGEVVDLRSFKVHDIILQGISRTFQNVELVREISVLENLLVACTREYNSNFWAHLLGLPIVKKEERLLKQKANRVLAFMGLENYANWLAMGLPYGILKKVEIARALMSNAKLIIMDEPAAGLNDTETAELAETIKKIRDEFGVTILLVEHDMKLVMGICDTVCAISFGKMLAIGTTEEIQNNKDVQEAYLGVNEDSEGEGAEHKAEEEVENE